MAPPPEETLLGDVFFDFDGRVFDSLATGLHVFANAFDGVAGGKRRQDGNCEQSSNYFFHDQNLPFVVA